MRTREKLAVINSHRRAVGRSLITDTDHVDDHLSLIELHAAYGNDPWDPFDIGERVFLTTDLRHVGRVCRVHPEDETIRIRWPRGITSHRVPVYLVRHALPSVGFDD